MTNPAQRFTLLFTHRLRARILVIALLWAPMIVALQSAQAQTFSVLHAFTGGGDGSAPVGGLAMSGAGTFYGTAYRSGTGGGGDNGVAYKLSLHQSSWLLTPLYEFTHGSDGANPRGGITIGPSGVPYGTTSGGEGGNGTVFKLTPPLTPCKGALCYWNETTLHGFTGGDGSLPEYSNLTFDGAGNIYGTTAGGGGLFGVGVVFELTPSGGGWTETVLYEFGHGSDGAMPYGGVTFDTAGNIYTTTNIGGGASRGTVVKLTPSDGNWTESILYSFSNDQNGYYPGTGLLRDGLGNLYGTTTSGGSGGGGTVFELTPSGGQWNFSLLYGFSGQGGPAAGNLTMDSAGNLYGATNTDGMFNFGMVFKLSLLNGSWTLTDLHDFTGGSDGAFPSNHVVLDSSGNLYGTAFGGGNYGGTCIRTGCGVIWEITP